jgi:hypothetical protein
VVVAVEIDGVGAGSAAKFGPAATTPTSSSRRALGLAVVDVLLNNHLPKSTLMMLVSAF